MEKQLHLENDYLSSNFILQSVNEQLANESKKCIQARKKNGVYLTHDLAVVDLIIESAINDTNLIKKKILEPSCGDGIFLQKILIEAIKKNNDPEKIKHFLENNLIFNDIDAEAVSNTKIKLAKIYRLFFNKEFKGKFNSYTFDFSKKINSSHSIGKHLNSIDYVVGNPPFVALYGRRDKKKTEELRDYYLKNFDQFPKSLKNGKINIAMMFIENSIHFTKKGGETSLVIDVSFFETAFKHTRKYLLEKVSITELHTNLKAFDVASGQIVLKLCNENARGNRCLIVDNVTKKSVHVDQNSWINESDEYKFRFYFEEELGDMLSKISNLNLPTLKTMYPKKNLRTCCMLLNMEKQFVNEKPTQGLQEYPYLEGSKGLPGKFSKPQYSKYFHYNKALQDKINDKLKVELEEQGIKNKKRIGLGESLVYDNPKVFIRQSAKEIIATYYEGKAASNNSLYVFTLRDDSQESRNFLKFLCGYLNSSFLSFYCQTKKIIRYSKGKQPQIKTSDLYQIPIPQDASLQKKISSLISDYPNDLTDREILVGKIDQLVNKYFDLSESDIRFMKSSISDFLKS